MQPLTAKELEYIADSMSNEELLIKQCISTAQQAPTPQVSQMCDQLASRHMQRYQHLMQVLQQHVQLAPIAVQ